MVTRIAYKNLGTLPDIINKAVAMKYFFYAATPPSSPLKQDKFPYLNDKDLTKEQRSRLVSRLEYESKSISRRFAILVARTGRSLKQFNITVKELRTLFGNDDKVLKALGKTKDLDKAMLKISKLC